jgi:response regulator of citrate/malate metabolism
MIKVLKVLIVEDDPMVRQINEKFLERVDGFAFAASTDSIEEAKKKIMTLEIDLILLDLFFPKGKGQDLLMWLRENEYKTDVIMITADKNTSTIETVLRYGAIDYLIKPFTFERLLESLNMYKARYNELNVVSDIGQEAVDEIILHHQGNTSEIGEQADASYNKHTLGRVYEFLNKNKNSSFTAQEVADRLGVSRITTRRYLDYLTNDNQIIMQLEYGKVGRPKNKFKAK